MIPNDQGGDKEARRNQGQISWDEIELSADWQVASELASRKCLAKISRKMWKTEINRNWKVKVMEGDREVAGSSTSLNKWPIPADARSYSRLTNTHQPVWVWPRELAAIRVFVETLWVKAMLVLCIGFFCWWSLSRQAILLKVVSFAPCQLPSCWIWPRELKRKWKAGGKKTIEHFWPTLSVLSNSGVREQIPLLGPRSHWVFSSEWPHSWTTSFSLLVSQMGLATAASCSWTTYWPHWPPQFFPW